jgi:GT2 family glycosyltransferase
VPVDEDVAAVLASELRRAQHPYRAALAARVRPVAPPIRPSPRASAATVSVIVAFHDAGLHLEQAIASVEAQEHDRFELILIDDGSTDSSTQIARVAAARDPERIRHLDHPGHANLGKSSSRNAGLRAARGDYVVFLDADDLLLSGKLSRQAAFLDAQREVDAVYGRTWYWDEPGEGGRARERLSRLGVRWGATQDPPHLLVRFLDQPGSVPCLCAFMARREVVLRLGGFDESLQDLYEDQTLIAKLALHCRIRVDAVPGERNRQHEGSSTARSIREGTYHPWRPNAARPGTSSGSSATALNWRGLPPARSPTHSPAPHARTATPVPIACSHLPCSAGTFSATVLSSSCGRSPVPEAVG